MLKSITLTADEQLIRRAREKARRERRSLNSVFREWLTRYVGQRDQRADFRVLMKRLSYARADRTFSRDELNER